MVITMNTDTDMIKYMLKKGTSIRVTSNDKAIKPTRDYKKIKKAIIKNEFCTLSMYKNNQEVACAHIKHHKIYAYKSNVFENHWF